MLLKRRRAILSIIEQANWISEESPDSALRFLEAVDETFALLLTNPEMGRQYQPIKQSIQGNDWAGIGNPRGRPRSGRPMSNSERQKKFRERQAATKDGGQPRKRNDSVHAALK